MPPPLLGIDRIIVCTSVQNVALIPALGSSLMEGDRTTAPHLRPPRAFISETSPSKHNPRQTRVHTAMPAPCVQKGGLCGDLSRANWLSAASHLETKYKLLASKNRSGWSLSSPFSWYHAILCRVALMLLHADKTPAAAKLGVQGICSGWLCVPLFGAWRS